MITTPRALTSRKGAPPCCGKCSPRSVKTVISSRRCTPTGGGRHVHFGSGVYANFNLTLVDDAHIYVGDCVVFGPNVTVATAGHPIEPGLRRQAMQYNADVRIGSNVWVGAGAVILPGVTIGDDTVIGAGSVVTKDIPAGVVAVGCPCRVLRPIGPQDREAYFRGRKIDVPLE